MKNFTPKLEDGWKMYGLKTNFPPKKPYRPSASFSRLGYSIATYFRFASSDEKTSPNGSQDPGVDSHLPQDVLFCVFKQVTFLIDTDMIIRIDPAKKKKYQIHTSTFQGVPIKP